MTANGIKTRVMRFALGLEYDGSEYFGWQRQPNGKTIQAAVEDSLSKVASEGIRVICAGRTDAGVHAVEQVVHFESAADRDQRAWALGANTHLPDDVRVIWARKVDREFHARYSPVARLYRYVILNRSMRSALYRNRVTWFYGDLSEHSMQLAANYLVGEHDFTSFRAKGCQSQSAFRRVFFINVNRCANKVIIDIAANAFLHHMVRNIVGVLLAIGSAKKPPAWALEVLVKRDRKAAAATAPPHGLYLQAICYPDQYGLTKHPGFANLPAELDRIRRAEIVR